MDTTARIKNEIAVAMERLGADPMLSGIVALWGDGLGDAEVLAMLEDWNRGTFRGASITEVHHPRPKLKIVR
jgi:hypothetical protein